MKQEMQDFLKKINKGRVYGSQRVIAKAAGVNEASVSQWLAGRSLPSESSLIKMAKKFKEDKDKLQKIFIANSNIGIGENNANNYEQTKDIELLKEIIKRLETEISSIKENHKLEMELLNNRIEKLEKRK